MSTFSDLYGDALKYALSSDTTSAKRFVNETRRELAYLASQVVTVSAVTMTSSANNYDLSAAPFSFTDMLALRQIVYNDTSGYVNVLEDSGLDYILNRQQTVSVAPPISYALEGAYRIYFDATVASGSAMTFHWVPTPSDLSSDSSTPTEIPTVWHYIISDGAAAKLAREDSPELAATLQQRYEFGCDKVRAHTNRRKGTRPARIMAGYPGRAGRLREPHDRSQYPVY